MNPYLCFAVVYSGMFALAARHPSIFGKYTDWIRLHLFAWATMCAEHPATPYLVWNNAVAGFISIHYFYILTKYELLDLLASRFYRNVLMVEDTGRVAHVFADIVVHGTPVLFAYFYMPERLSPPPFWFWLVTGVPHATYGRLLLGHWSIKPFYGVCTTDFSYDCRVTPACILLGHFSAQCLFYVFF